VGVSVGVGVGVGKGISVRESTEWCQCRDTNACLTWQIHYFSMLTSTHSVAPIKPYSSASQLHKIMVRPGLQSVVGGCFVCVGEEGEGERELNNNLLTYNT